MREKLIAKIKALLNRTIENGASLYEAETAPSLKSAFNNGVESAKNYNLNRPIDNKNNEIKLIKA